LRGLCAALVRRAGLRSIGLANLATIIDVCIQDARCEDCKFYIILEYRYNPQSDRPQPSLASESYTSSISSGLALMERAAPLGPGLSNMGTTRVIL
jgi:hypothetical protein